MLSLIRELSELHAVSGNEDAVRNVITEKIRVFADELTVDSMGNLIAFKRGRAPNDKKIVVSAHMDEVGFIISDITEDGFLKFKCVGGIDPRILPAQNVLIGEDRVCGVIGIKAVHLKTAEEQKNAVKIKDMYIDIGADSKDEALQKVRKGDYACFDSDFVELGGGFVKAKALDDRVGCAMLCELIKRDYDCDVYFCFSVQEEVGLRGARVIAPKLNADCALVLESTTCSDIAGAEPHEYVTSAGMGPAVSLMDRASYSDKDLNRFICRVADENKIPYQFKKSAMGGNDAGAYQNSAGACKTAVISLPCRYIHSPVSCASADDISNMYALAENILKTIHTFDCGNRSE